MNMNEQQPLPPPTSVSAPATARPQFQRKVFAEQKGGQRKATLATLKRTIEELAGEGNVPALLEALVASRFWEKYTKTTQGVTNPSKKLKKLVVSIHKQWKESTNPRRRRQWSSLVCPVLQRKELSFLGWEMCSETFANARKYAEDYGPGSIEVPKPKGEREESSSSKDMDTDLQPLPLPQPVIEPYPNQAVEDVDAAGALMTVAGGEL